MPWHGATLIGTTETPYRGDAGPRASAAGRKRNICSRSCATISRPSGALDARATSRERFAGLRVLPAATQAAFDRSRETIFTTDRDVCPRVLGIYGGKLTGWRAAAAHVMQRIGTSLPAAAQAGRDGSVDFEETDMNKNGMARWLALCVDSRRWRTPRTISARPTNASAYRLGVDVPVEQHRPAARQQHGRCRARRSTRRTILAWTSPTSSPRFQAMVRVGERHRLRFDYFTLDRTGQTTRHRQPIVFRDVMLQPGDPRAIPP